MRKSEKTPKILTESTHRVTVDYGMTLREMIAASKSVWTCNDEAIDLFTVTGEGKKDVEIILLGFSTKVTCGWIDAELEKRGLRGARVEELLALGAKEPDLQRKFYIPAFGTLFPSLNDHAYVYLSGHHAGLGLGCGWEWKGGPSQKRNKRGTLRIPAVRK